MRPVTEATEALRNTASQTREKITDAVQGTKDRLEINVHRHPTRTVLLSLGAGLLIGLVLGLGTRRGRSSD